MAGSGDLSAVGWQHALNAGIGSTITGVPCTGPPGDLIGTITTGVATNTSLSSFTLSGGISKAVPDEATLVSIPAAGTTGAMQLWVVAGAAASAATTVNVDAQTTRTVGGAISNGDLLYMVNFAPFVSLNTTAPTQTALGTEYSATGYARIPLTLTATTTTTSPVSANNATITFGPMTAGTGTAITNGAIMDALSGGTASNMYAFYTWGTSKNPGVGDSVQIAPAALSTAGS